MKLTLNGEIKEFPASMTLQQLLTSLGIMEGRVACELNLKIIRRAQYANTVLNEGDVLEVIQAIGGG